VRLPRFIGDAVMISQALEPLRAAGLPLVAWGGGAVAELFEGSNAFEAVMADAPGKPSAWTLASLLRVHRAQAVICLPRSNRAIFAGLLAGVPKRAGWGDGIGWLLCSDALSFGRLQGHQCERYAALLRKAFPACLPQPFRAFRPRPESQAAADRLLEGCGRPFLAIGVGAMSWNKRVGVGVWIALAQLLAGQGTGLVLLGAGPEEFERAEQICREVPGCLNLVGKSSLSVTAGVLHRARGAVGGDSALSHLASACGVPTVTVFGPTDPTLTSAPQPWARVLRRGDLPCLPCRRFDCRQEGHPCMERVDPGAILEALGEAAQMIHGGEGPPVEAELPGPGMG
jgi:ADP-heptose:LPS heptosyltransferase